MYFGLVYDNGYVVTLSQVWDDGFLRSKPLRKFEEQGDAKVYQLYDCPKLTSLDIKFLVKNYNPDIKFIRIGDNKFRFFKSTINDHFTNKQLTLNF